MDYSLFNFNPPCFSSAKSARLLATLRRSERILASLTFDNVSEPKTSRRRGCSKVGFTLLSAYACTCTCRFGLASFLAPPDITDLGIFPAADLQFAQTGIRARLWNSYWFHWPTLGHVTGDLHIEALGLCKRALQPADIVDYICAGVEEACYVK